MHEWTQRIAALLAGIGIGAGGGIAINERVAMDTGEPTAIHCPADAIETDGTAPIGSDGVAGPFYVCTFPDGTTVSVFETGAIVGLSGDGSRLSEDAARARLAGD